MNVRNILVAGILAALHSTAHASLIAPIEYNSGEHTWLTLSETVDLSIADFKAGVGGWNTKYRLASNTEIRSLLATLGLEQGDSGYKTLVPGAGDFVFSMGGGTIYAGTWGYDGNQGALGRGTDWFVSVELTNGTNSVPLSNDCPAYFSCARSIVINQPQSELTRGSDTGLFLIRDDISTSVPEPSTTTLLALAGGVLIYQRRRSKRQ